MDAIIWCSLSQPAISSSLRLTNKPTLLKYKKQQGQSLVESVLLTAIIGAIWWLPEMTTGKSVYAIVRDIVMMSKVNAGWLLNQFLLNPLVG